MDDFIVESFSKSVRFILENKLLDKIADTIRTNWVPVNAALSTKPHNKLIQHKLER